MFLSFFRFHEIFSYFSFFFTGYFLMRLMQSFINETKKCRQIAYFILCIVCKIVIRFISSWKKCFDFIIHVLFPKTLGWLCWLSCQKYKSISCLIIACNLSYLSLEIKFIKELAPLCDGSRTFQGHIRIQAAGPIGLDLGSKQYLNFSQQQILIETSMFTHSICMICLPKQQPLPATSGTV